MYHNERLDFQRWLFKKYFQVLNNNILFPESKRKIVNQIETFRFIRLRENC
jgi:hypothetical protein